MGWVVNQIWIGGNPPAEKLRETKEKSLSFGWDYRLWTWDDLTSTFGFFFFRNFILEKLNDTALTFLAKFYLWHILAMQKDHGMFLDATREFPFSEVYGDYTFARPGVYTSPTYTPWFIACSHPEAAALAKGQVTSSLELRYKANRERMFKFFLTSKYNILGQRYFQNTLMPLFRTHGVKVYNDVNPFKTSPLYSDIPDYLLPSVAFGRAGNISITPAAHKILTASAQRKVKPVITLVPVNVSRVVILGDDIMGITDPDVISQKGDLFIHVDSCPSFTRVEWVENIYHSVYFTRENLVPREVREKKEEFVSYSQVIPSASFYGYKWTENLASSVSPRLSLACSFRELNPDIPVILYGYNQADNLAHGYDSELEEVLAKQSGVTIVPPKYSFLYLILTRRGNLMQRVKLKRGWLHYLSDHSTYRFIHGGKQGKEDHTWAFTGVGDDEKDDDIGLRVYAAMINALQMNFDYLFLLPDDKEVDPLSVENWVDREKPVTFGVREYLRDEDVLVYSFSHGVGLSRTAVEKVLEEVSAETAAEMKERPDLLLAHRVKETGLPTTDASPVLLNTPV